MLDNEGASGGRHFGCGFGSAIASAIAVPGLRAALPDDPGDSDIDILLAPIAPKPARATTGPYALRDDGLLFDAPGVGCYLAQGDSRLIVAPAEGASPESVTDLLIATALPMLLWQRGGIVLHAACVQVPGRKRAVAIAGRSGSGKSTIAAQLIEGGAALVADDTLWLHATDDGAAVSGLCAGTFQRTGAGEDRRFVPVPASQQQVMADLGAILFLGEDHSNAVQPLTGPAALEMLLRHRHRPRIPAILGRERDGFAQCILHSRAIPTYAVRAKDDEHPGSHQHIIDFIADLC